MKRISKKGQRFTSDYIDYNKASLKGHELLWENKPIVGFYIIFAINTGLRVSDILSRKHSDLEGLKAGDYLRLEEIKTKKYREVQINQKIVEAYKYLMDKENEQGRFKNDYYIFRSQKGTVYAIESLNTILKKVFAGYAENISTHSLRKSFGRHVYETYGKSEDSLVLLSELFQHASLSVTRRYLGLRREELGSIYMNL